jgi:ech hydrogenase subunit E
MPTKTIIPFGPQHPVLPEPIHLDLVLEDERVVEAIPQIGFVHRGLEKLAEKRDYPDMLFVAERICGICSCIHGHGYCEGIEAIMKVEIPPRARFLRVIYDEMSRIHSHLLWLGLLADSFGFESLFMHCWRVRENLLDMVEELTGGRVIFGIHKIGGVRRDIPSDKLADLLRRLKAMEKECREVTSVFEKDGSVHRRQVGIGVLSKEEAYSLGAAGPTLRGSGVKWDARNLGYSAYKELAWEPVVETAGDCQARTMVRIREVFMSFDLIYQAASKLPGGPVEVAVKGNPSGEYITRLEQPRGEVVYYIKGNGTKNLERFRVRTPTFANVPALVVMLKGEELAAVPVITLTIDPCISCTER